MHHLAEEDFPGQVSRSILTQSMLINGRGRFYNVCKLLFYHANRLIFDIVAD